MNTNVHSLIHKKNANKLPYKLAYMQQFYILAYMLLNLQPIIRKFCFYSCKDFVLIFLLTFTIEPQLNTQTSLISLHTFKTSLYTHSDKKCQAVETGIHTSLHNII